MRDFQRLERVCIQPEVLLGGCCGDSPAPFQLIDTLPPSLKSLTLYGDEGLARNKTLSQQIQSILATTQFPRLGHLMLESTFDGIHCYTDPVDPPHADVEQACRRSGRKYESMPASLCKKGGIGSAYYRQVEENRLQMGQKLGKIRYAVREYLSRLRERAADHRDATVHPHELSLEDLDTYELPWEDLTAETLYPDTDNDMELDYEVSSSDYDSEI